MLPRSNVEIACSGGSWTLDSPWVTHHTNTDTDTNIINWISYSLVDLGSQALEFVYWAKRSLLKMSSSNIFVIKHADFWKVEKLIRKHISFFWPSNWLLLLNYQKSFYIYNDKGNCLFERGQRMLKTSILPLLLSLIVPNRFITRAIWPFKVVEHYCKIFSSQFFGTFLDKNSAMARIP